MYGPIERKITHAVKVFIIIEISNHYDITWFYCCVWPVQCLLRTRRDIANHEKKAAYCVVNITLTFL